MTGDIIMANKLLYILLVVSISCFHLDAYDQDMLKVNDVNRIMKQILEHHVDKKEMTATVLQNSLIAYIDQFDPHRIYLLESDLAPYVNLSPTRLNQLIEQYKRQDLSVFKQLNDTIQVSIRRSRKLREEIEVDSSIFYKKLNQEGKEPGYESFATTITELKARLSQQLALFVSLQRKRRHGEEPLKQESLQKELIQAYEDQFREFENNYLYESEKGQPLPTSEQENLFTIHILKALASSLDAHTTFYQAKEAYDMRVRLQKEFFGIGVVLKDTPTGAIVSRLLEGGPAAKSGLIQSGDVLVEVDGKRVMDHPFEKIMEMLHNDKKNEVILVFRRLGENGQADKMFTVTLKREEIILNNDRVDVKAETFGNGIIGILTLHSFYQGEGISSEKDMREAIQKLEKKGNLRGLILDLRDNSGGFLSQAVKVAGLFITNGVIVISKYSDGDEKIYRDVDGKIAYDGPLIVLTSKATASAAEIVAQALQDYGVAVIVGDEHTYGKGTIQSQTVTDNQSSSYFKVTVGKYYTVSGRTPQKQGVKADIIVPGHWSHEQIGEEYLESTLEPDTIEPIYDDKLVDVSSDVKPWYLKYYVPKLQRRTNAWYHMLPTLRKNSSYRIEHNKNYQYFIKGGKGTPEENEEDEWMTIDKKDLNAGEDDLQLQEAISIVKDMVLLHSLQSPAKKESHSSSHQNGRVK